jgi:hypothetical protein
MQIKQVYFSQSVKFFEKKFLERWGLEPYHDNTKPALFKGVYRPGDVSAINNHKGFKVVWHTGRARPHIMNVNPKDVIVRLCPISISDRKHNPTPYNEHYFNGFKTKYANFPLKDWSDYKPVPLGGKVYCYLGNERAKDIMGFKEIDALSKKIDFEIIIGYRDDHDFIWVRDNHYRDSFINIKPSITGGYASATEMAYMGRYTISNGWSPFCLPYKSIDEMAEIVKRESKHIGELRDSVVGGYYDTGDEWMDVDFWLTNDRDESWIQEI